MARDLFEEGVISAGGRDLFEEEQGAGKEAKGGRDLLSQEGAEPREAPVASDKLSPDHRRFLQQQGEIPAEQPRPEPETGPGNIALGGAAPGDPRTGPTGDPERNLIATGGGQAPKPAGADSTLEALDKVLIENVPGRYKQYVGGLMQQSGSTAAERIGGRLNEAAEDNDSWADNLMTAFGLAKEALPLIVESNISEDSPYAQFRNWMGSKGEELYRKGRQEVQDNQPVGLNTGEQFFVDAARAVEDMLPGVAASAATKSPAPMLTMIGGQVYGQTYGEGVNELGLDPYRADARATAHTLAEVVPETIPALAFIGRTKGARRFIDATLGEGVQEGLTSILQQTYDNKELENMSLKDALAGVDWSGVGRDALLGVAVGSTLYGGVRGTEKLLGRDRDREEPEPDQGEDAANEQAPPDVQRRDDGIDYEPPIPEATDEVTTEPGAAPPPTRYEGGIDFEAQTQPEPLQAGVEAPRQADRRVQRDKTIQEQEQRLGDVTLPEGLEDSRLKREPYRGGIQQLAGELQTGGGIAMVPQEGAKPTSDTGDVLYDYGTDNVVRTPSLNPSWFQSMVSNPETQVSVEQAQNAVNKALKGERLGVREARVVQGFLDQVQGERTDPQNIESVQRELQKARDLRALAAEGWTPEQVEAFADNAGQRLDEAEYDADLTGEARTVRELMAEAEAAGIDYDRVTDAASQQDDAAAARRLWELIQEANNAPEQTQPAAPESAGPVQSGRTEQARPEIPQRDGQPVRGPQAENTGESGAPATGDSQSQPLTGRDLFAEPEQPIPQQTDREKTKANLQRAKKKGRKQSEPQTDNKPESEQRAESIRDELSEDQIRDEIESLTAKARKEYDEYREAGVDNGSLISEIDFLSETERARLDDLKRALPSFGEEARAAKQRLEERARQRKAGKPEQTPSQEGVSRSEGQETTKEPESAKTIAARQKARGVDTAVSEKGNLITIDKMVVPEDQRGQGVGTQALQELVDYADANGKTIALTPSKDFGARSIEQLKRFYKRQGFVENKGRNRDLELSESMYRSPQQEPAQAAAQEQADTATPETQEASQQPAEKPQTESKPAQPQEKIDDFGEKIEGSRKEMWQKYAERMEGAKQVDTAAQPLAKSWPEPDYQALIDNGADPKAVALVRALRDEIPSKPRAKWKVRGWVNLVEGMRGHAESIINGDLSVSRVYEILDDQRGSLPENIRGRAELYEAVGHEHSLKGVTFARREYAIYKGEKDVTRWTVEKPPKSNSLSNWPQELAVGKTRDEALDQFKKNVASGMLDGEGKKGKAPVRFSIYQYRIGDTKRTYIGKKVGKDYLDLESFDTVKEARDYLRDNQDKLEAKLAKMKEIPAHRKESNSPRVGADHRNGGDVTPQQFGDTFGFRGVQFGNYVEQGRRQQDLNEAYDALMDLAGVLNLPPRALSLNGELGLAFGARGKGAAGRGKGHTPKAHYESGNIVINLTKREGAGSLAHEWWHSLDNYFSRARGEGDRFLTETPYKRGEGVRPEVVEAFNQVNRAIKQTRLKQRASILDKTRSKEYWSTGREMSARSFESYVIEKLKDNEQSNDYLANIVSEDYWNAAAKLGLEKEGTYPYPEAAEIPVIREAFDNFFRVIETREDSEGNVAIFRRSDFPEQTTEQVEGISVPAARVNDWAQALTSRLKGAPKVHVIGSMREAPARVREADQRQRSQGATGAPEGFYYRGEVYLVLEGIERRAGETDAQAIMRVWAHEVLGHSGLRGVFGQKLTRVLREVSLRRRKDVRAKASEYGLVSNMEEARAAVREPGMTGAQIDEAARKRLDQDLLTAAEEVLAEMAQTTPDATLVQKAVKAIRDALNAMVRLLPGKIRRSMGGTRFQQWLDEMTDAEIIERFLIPAREFIRTGRAPAGDTSVRFSRSRDDNYGIEVEELTDEQAQEYFSGRRVRRNDGDGAGSAGRLGSQDSGQQAGENLATVGGRAPREGWAAATRASVGGRPAVLNRGAARPLSAGSFSQSRLGGASGNPSSGLGVWITDDPAEAQQYADQHENGVNEPFYLDIRQPMIFKDGDLPGFNSPEQAYQFRESLKRQGYDGIVHDMRGIGGAVHYVAFEADQVIYPDPSIDDVRFSFAGRQASTADERALATAQERLAAGEDVDAVRQETGWFRGADGKWRFEIDDSQAKLKPAIKSIEKGEHPAKQIDGITYKKNDDGTFDLLLRSPSPQRTDDFISVYGADQDVLDAVLPNDAVSAIKEGKGEADYIGPSLDDAKAIDASFSFEGMNALPLGKVLEHPALFAAYPSLSDVMVQVDPSLGVGGSFVIMDNGERVIRIGKGRQLSSLLHEIQHGIQDVEGFARGGRPDQFSDIDRRTVLLSQIREAIDARWAEIPDNLKDAARKINRGDDADGSAMKAIQKNPQAKAAWADYTKALQDYEQVQSAPESKYGVDTAASQYERLYGEVEARNAQARQNMTEEQRRATPPEETADIPDSDVIIVWNGQEMDSMPRPANAAQDQPLFSRAKHPTTLTDMPDAVIAAEHGAMEKHKRYKAAKAGDPDAAYEVVRDTLTDDAVRRIMEQAGDSTPTIVPVHAEEASGRNKIPLAFAEQLSAKTGWPVSTSVVQATRAKRTGADGFYRIANPPEFAGEIESGRDYLLLDDTLAQGGTIANLKAHIEAQGGNVVGATALTGKKYSAKLAPSKTNLNLLRSRHGDSLDRWLQDTVGYGYESLTNSEARYLAQVKGHDADSIRDRIATARSEAEQRADARADQAGRNQTSQEVNQDPGQDAGVFDPDDPMLSRAKQEAQETVADAGPIIQRAWDKMLGRVLKRTDSWVQKIDNAVNGVTDLDNLSDYLEMRMRAQGKIGQVQDAAKRLYDTFKKADEKNSKAILEYLTDRDAKASTIPDIQLRQKAQIAKRMIDQMGRSLVQHGVIPVDSYKNYQGRYLPRLYMAYMLGDKAVNAIGGGKKLSSMGYAMARDESLPQEYRDIVLGEIKDPGFLASRAIGVPGRDIALMEFFEEIAQRDTWVIQDQFVDVKIPGLGKSRRVTAFWAKSEANRVRDMADRSPKDMQPEMRRYADKLDEAARKAMDKLDYDTNTYKQLPDSPKYGALRGMIVARRIYDDIEGVAQMGTENFGSIEKHLRYGGTVTSVTKAWKTSKVALNPPSQVRNLVSNFVLINLSGVPGRKMPGLLARAAKQIRTKGEFYKVAQTYGITSSTFSANELYKMESELLDLRRRDKGWMSMAGLHEAAQIIVNNASDAYGAAEMLGKLVKIMHEMDKGASAARAAMEADKWLFDYSLVNRNIKYLRNAPVGAPFLTFYMKVLPRLLEVATHHPWRLLPYYAMFKALPMIIAAMYGSDEDDVEKLEKAMPEWLQDQGSAVIFPYKDSQGRWQAFNIGYFLPWTMWTDMAGDLYKAGKATATGDLTDEYSSFLRGSGFLSGPLPDGLAAGLTNIDPFTKREIVDDRDPAIVQNMQRLNYLYTMFAPPWLTERGVVGHMYRSVTGHENRWGDEIATPAQASLRMVGINIYPIDPERSRQTNLKFMKRDIEDIKSRARYRTSDPNLTEEERQAIKEDYEERINLLEERLKKYQEESEVPLSLRTD